MNTKKIPTGYDVLKLTLEQYVSVTKGIISEIEKGKLTEEKVDVIIQYYLPFQRLSVQIDDFDFGKAYITAENGKIYVQLCTKNRMVFVAEYDISISTTPISHIVIDNGNSYYHYEQLAWSYLVLSSTLLLSKEDVLTERTTPIRDVNTHKTKKVKNKTKQNIVHLVKYYTLKSDAEISDVVKITRKHIITCPKWTVKGHWRKLRNGGQTWIAPYPKGKERMTDTPNTPKTYKI